MHSFSSTRMRLLKLALSVLVMFVGALAHAQDAASRISGTVIDGQGRAVGSALVTVKGGGLSKTTRADANGAYAFDSLPAGTYLVVAEASGFSSASKDKVALAAGQAQQLEPLTLSIASVAEQITVNAGVDSIAAETAPSGGFIEERSAQSLVSEHVYRELHLADRRLWRDRADCSRHFTSAATASDLARAKPTSAVSLTATLTLTSTAFPFTTPTRRRTTRGPSSPRSGLAEWTSTAAPAPASTIGPTPFGGSIHLLSKPLASEQDIRATASYGTWNTKLYDGSYNSGSFGLFGRPKKSNLFVDVHHMSSDGYQTFNCNTRNAGSLFYQYQFSPKTVLTGFSGVISLDANTYGLNPTRCQTIASTPSSLCSATTTINNCIQYGAQRNSPSSATGYKFEMVNNADPCNWLDYQYNHYHVPTDFEYVGLRPNLHTAGTWT